ncbi:hypothetical protein L5515_009439 [Caenorhabditis briggsae]|uniref:Uncharacterized protein n=1 Tax=Caenorhabditis briggsae TaxID=6238 RepID=A0AAE9F8R6_CAEBR|nr:hypothetical protein L5515_009439 [Caenorhabditis briggsae]
MPTMLLLEHVKELKFHFPLQCHAYSTQHIGSRSTSRLKAVKSVKAQIYVPTTPVISMEICAHRAMLSLAGLAKNVLVRFGDMMEDKTIRYYIT